MKVPFVDLKAGIAPHRQEYLDAIAKVVDSAWFVGGPAVDEFETAFANFCGAPQCVSVNSGTDALILMLRALDVGPGDEVITAANSFFATAEAITLVGAKPVFADVSDDTLLIDPDDVEKRVTPRTKAVIPVHLFGQMAPMDKLSQLCEAHALILLEDSAQAHGATRNGRTAGSIGEAAGFSFYPAKNLGAFGEGGAITCQSADVAARLRSLRNHGQGEKNVHDAVGYNARLSSLLCAALSVRLRYLPEANEGRQAAAARYRERLAGVSGVRLVDEDAAGVPVYHLMIARVQNREAVRAALGEAGVASGMHYPIPIHLQPAYRELGQEKGSCAVAEKAADEILSLPMYPELSEAAVDYVCEQLEKAVG